ncbi:hypothetical protein N7456_013485 [Penicillium angulare]|uniref:Uncharacterized protein n=1 Tax=Penicillium angulare TaxID=116970 RepID=A0A9W9EGE6_9EURO|nr:hypothetical protein N7456_013485 [Penicillium angulare]
MIRVEVLVNEDYQFEEAQHQTAASEHWLHEKPQSQAYQQAVHLVERLKGADSQSRLAQTGENGDSPSTLDVESDVSGSQYDQSEHMSCRFWVDIYELISNRDR